MSNPNGTIILKKQVVRDFVHNAGKQLTHEFFMALNDFAFKKLEQACGQHNGGKKRLDIEVAAFVGIKP